MPEEINRVLTDQVADRLYTTERSAEANLRREGIPAERVCFAGNVMIDTLRFHKDHARAPERTLEAHGIDTALLGDPAGWGVVTLHRPSNVDARDTLHEALQALRDAAERLPLIFAMHPRTRRNIERFGLGDLVDGRRIAALPPQGYLEMLGLMAGAAVVITDSGGLQEETTALGVPCLTMRENTERPITVDEGTNTVVGRDRAAFARALDAILSGDGKRGRVPERWDGRAAERIAADLWQWLSGRT
jgi:UDP-N-acetylglucosamine 2-epimerase (non-hydrolysing)